VMAVVNHVSLLLDETPVLLTLWVGTITLSCCTTSLRAN